MGFQTEAGTFSQLTQSAAAGKYSRSIPYFENFLGEFMETGCRCCFKTCFMASFLERLERRLCPGN
jgi:hypothetical protein